MLYTTVVMSVDKSPQQGTITSIWIKIIQFTNHIIIQQLSQKQRMNYIMNAYVGCVSDVEYIFWMNVNYKCNQMFHTEILLHYSIHQTTSFKCMFVFFTCTYTIFQDLCNECTVDYCNASKHISILNVFQHITLDTFNTLQCFKINL